MPTNLTVLLALLILSWQTALPLAAEESDVNMVMAQIHQFTAENEAQLETEILRLKAAGFNAISVRMFQNINDSFHGMAKQNDNAPFTGVYFNTDKAPIVADLLTPLSGICRKHNIALYAWMTSRTMDWLDMPLAKDMVYSSELPDFAATAKHFDLFNQDFLEYVSQLFSDLAVQGIRGIIVQDDLVIKTREAMTREALIPFATSLGLQESLSALRQRIHNDSKLFQIWSVYREEHVLSVTDRLRQIIEDKHSKSMGINIYPDTVLNETQGLHWLAQSLKSIEARPPRLIVFMAYIGQLSDELNISLEQARQLMQQLIIEMEERFGDKLLVKLQIKSWKTGADIPLSVYRTIRTRANKLALAPVSLDDASLNKTANIVMIMRQNQQ